jgi:seryl-tRNA synthetase
LRPLKAIPAKVIFSHTENKPQCSEDVFAKLVESGDISVLSDGIMALKGLPLQMMEVLDRKLVDFAKNQKAQKILLPITVNFKNLLDSHYFDRTPQHANFLSTIEEDARSISNFSKHFKKNNEIDKDLIKSPHSMCRSAVCLNSYPTMRDKKFSNEESVILTAEGRVFRHEYKKVNSLERLYEFSCREIIYLGKPEFVKARLKECENWFINFLNEYNINGLIKSATDPFFMENARNLQFYQAAEDSKYEIRALNPFTSTDVSIGSLNFHGNHFSKSYNITFENGEHVSSGCVGFGLERTVFTIIAQFGVDTKKWPANLKNYFEV